MCGRAKLPEDVSELKLDLRIDWDRTRDFRPRWNAAPTNDLPVVTSTGGKRSLEIMRWGLIPSWAKGIKVGYSTFNARAEMIDTKPTFRDAWREGRRCLVVVDAYYEWRRTDKQPFAVSLKSRRPMAFAGLWERWRAPEGTTIKSFTIITTHANAFLSGLHDRMPVVLSSGFWA